MKKRKSTAAPAYEEGQSCNTDGAGLPQHDENVLLRSSLLPSARDSSGFLICIMAMDTTILHVNGAHATALGYDSGELVGSKGMDIVHPEDHARLLPLLARYAEQFAGLTLKNIFAGGSTPLTETVQYRVKDKSGQWHWLEGVGSIIENRIYALSRDITSDFNTQIPHKQIMAGLWKSSAEHKASEEELIQQLLNAVGPAMGVSRACYNTFSDGDAPGGELVCRMEWCAEGIKPSIGIKMPSLLVKHTLRNEFFLLTPTTALENLPVPLRPMGAPLVAAISKACDLESVLAVPFFVGDEMAGVLSFDVCASASHKPEWTADMKDLVAEAVNIVSNLAARRRAEAELARHRQSLETLVDERTGQLSAANRELEDEILHHRQTLDAWKRSEEERRKLEDRLKRAEKMEAVGILAGGVAHDLNNILAGVVSYPDLLLMDLPPESPLRESIRAIKDSGLKAAAVVNDLLTLARRGMMKCEPVNLNQVAEEFLRSPEYRRIASDYPKVRIRQCLCKSPHTILGSQLHLSKALMNLLLNACEAITGGGDVTVATRNQHLSETLYGYDAVTPGDYGVLRIADSGTGIAAADVNRIFEPFYTKKVMNRRNSGLGLSVVWGTVKDLEGSIDIISSENAGTVFDLYFPAVEQKADAHAAVVDVSAYRGRGERILVVDDEEGQREIASAILSKLGYAPVTAPGCEEAIRLLRKETVDLVVLDMIMDNGPDGLQTYQEILKIRPGQKAIISSGFAEEERAEKAMTLGAGAFVRKPYTAEMLGTAVRKELDRPALRDNFRPFKS